MKKLIYIICILLFSLSFSSCTVYKQTNSRKYYKKQDKKPTIVIKAREPEKKKKVKSRKK